MSNNPPLQTPDIPTILAAVDNKIDQTKQEMHQIGAELYNVKIGIKKDIETIGTLCNFCVTVLRAAGLIKEVKKGQFEMTDELKKDLERSIKESG